MKIKYIKIKKLFIHSSKAIDICPHISLLKKGLPKSHLVENNSNDIVAYFKFTLLVPRTLKESLVSLLRHGGGELSSVRPSGSPLGFRLHSALSCGNYLVPLCELSLAYSLPVES